MPIDQQWQIKSKTNGDRSGVDFQKSWCASSNKENHTSYTSCTRSLNCPWFAKPMNTSVVTSDYRGEEYKRVKSDKGTPKHNSNFLFSITWASSSSRWRPWKICVRVSWSSKSRRPSKEWLNKSALFKRSWWHHGTKAKLSAKRLLAAFCSKVSIPQELRTTALASRLEIASSLEMNQHM